MKIFKRYLRIFVTAITNFFELIYGSFRVLRISYPRVTFFGGSRWDINDERAKIAYELAFKLAQKNISIITGGGPGIMEGANCGAANARPNETRSMGISVKNLPGEEGVNTCAQSHLLTKDFFVRKWLLISYSIGFVIFPGGYGTVDELCTVLTLIQTKKLERVPIILIGTDYWKLFLEWLEKSVLHEGAITKKELNFIRITDDIEEACLILESYCNSYEYK